MTNKTSKKTVQKTENTDTVFIKYENSIGGIEKIQSGVEIFHNIEETAYQTMINIGTNADKQKQFTDSLKSADTETKIRRAKRKLKQAEKDESVTLTDEEKEYSKMTEQLTDEQLRIMKAEQTFLLSSVKIGGKRRGKSFFD